MNPAAPSPSAEAVAQAYQEARDGKFVHTNIVGLFALIEKRAREIDTSAPADAVGGAVVEGLKAAYNAGWHECARMAKRDDLHCDIDSPFVEGKRQAAIESAIAGKAQSTPAAPVGGFVVVPREPTDEMVMAGGKALLPIRNACCPDNDPQKIYAAMIAASPAAQPSAKGGGMVDAVPEYSNPAQGPDVDDFWVKCYTYLCRAVKAEGYVIETANGEITIRKEATTAAGLVDGDIPPELQDAWDAIDDVTFGPLSRYAKDVIARYITPGMKGYSRIVGSRTIDGVHIIVAKPASELMPEQLLVRYDTYLSAIGNASQALQAIVDYEGDINTPIRTITKLRGIARAATQPTAGTGEAAIGREVGR